MMKSRLLFALSIAALVLTSMPEMVIAAPAQASYEETFYEAATELDNNAELEETSGLEEQSEATDDEIDESEYEVEAPVINDAGDVFEISESGVLTAYNSTSIANVVIPATVTSIGDSVFKDHTEIVSVDMSQAAITSIGYEAFRNCSFGTRTSTSELVIPGTVTSIGRCAFKDCKYLGKVTFADSVTDAKLDFASSYDDGHAFAGCTSLKSVIFSKRIEKIGVRAFKGCTALESVEFKEGNKIIGEGAFEDAAALCGLAIPNSVEKIESYAFKNAGVNALSLGNSVEYIGREAFYACPLGTKLGTTELTIPGTVTYIGLFAFKNCTYLGKLTFEDNLTRDPITFQEAYDDGHYFANCVSLKNVSISSRVTTIGQRAFQNCTALETVTFSDGIEEIRDAVFENDSKLSAVILPDSVKTVGNYAFSKCGITKLKLSSNLEKIGGYAFAENPLGTKLNLTSMTIPRNVGYIGKFAFNKAAYLEKVVFEDNAELLDITLDESWSEGGQFNECPNLKSVELSDRMTTVNYTMFKNCPLLEKVVLKDGLKKIYKSAFENCTMITSLDIPDSVELIDEYAYKNTSIKNLSIGNGVKTIGREAFAGCPLGTKTKPGKVIIPGSVIDMGPYVFSECDYLKSVKFGFGSLEVSLSGYLFQDCKSLESVEFSMFTDPLPSRVIYNCPAIKDVYISKEIRSVADDMIYDTKNVTVHGTKDTPAYEYYKANKVNGYKWADWKEKSPVNITVDATKLSYVYDDAPIDITKAFVLDSHCGRATYSLAEGYKGSMTADGKLTVGRAGTFKISVETAETENYTAGYCTATISVTVLHPLTITFDSVGGSAVPSITDAVKNWTIDAPSDPSKEGFYFVGWYRDSEYAEKWDFEKDKVTENITLYAKWKDKSYCQNVRSDVEAGYVPAGTIVCLFTDTIDADIFYTTDGSEPDADSILYTEAITIDESVEIRAIAVKEGLNHSAVSSFIYSTSLAVPDWGDILPSDRSRFETVEDVPTGLWVAGVPDAAEYTGQKITFDVHIYYGKTRLVNKADYKLQYKNNVKVCEAFAVNAKGKSISPVIMIKGAGSYKGTYKREFSIRQTLDNSVNIGALSIKKTIIEGVTDKEYCGEAVSQNIIVKDKASGAVLTEGVDYRVAHNNNVNAGKATVFVTGIGNYSGVVKKNFRIKPVSLADVSKVSITVAPSVKIKKKNTLPEISVEYTNAKGEVIMLKPGKEFKLKGTNNKKVGSGANVSIIGLGNFNNGKNVNFTIEPQSLSEMTVVANDKAYSTKAGKYKATFTIYDSDGNALKKSDYDSSSIEYTYAEDFTDPETGIRYFEGNKVDDTHVIPAGTVLSVAVRGKTGGSFVGSVSANYKITKNSIAKAKLSIPKQQYSGKRIKPGKDIIVIKAGQSITASDYTIVGYGPNTNKGSGYVIVRGRGNYGGIKIIKFKIDSCLISGPNPL